MGFNPFQEAFGNDLQRQYDNCEWQDQGTQQCDFNWEKDGGQYSSGWQEPVVQPQYDPNWQDPRMQRQLPTDASYDYGEPHRTALNFDIEVKEREENALVVEKENQKSMQMRSAKISAAMDFADDVINRGYLSRLNSYDVLKPRVDSQFGKQMRVFKLTRLIYEEGEDINEKLISVYGALHNIRSRVFLMLSADKFGIDFYISTAVEKNGDIAASLAGEILQNGLQGNFPGSIRRDEIYKTALDQQQTEKLMRGIFESSRFSGTSNHGVAAVTMIPSERGKQKESFVQGLEKLINALHGKQYTAMFLAAPLTHDVIDARKSGLEYLYSTISPMGKTSFSYGENVSKAVTEGISRSFSESVNTSITDSNSENHSVSTSVTDTKGTSDGTTITDSYGSSFGSSSQGLFGGTDSSGTNIGSSFGRSHTTSKSRSKTRSVTSGESFTHSVTTGSSQTNTNTVNDSVSNTLGENRTFNITYENKAILDMMEHVDEHLKRIKLCESFGLWDCAAYFIAEDAVAMNAASVYHSLMTGESSQIEQSFVNFWSASDNQEKILDIKKYLMQGYHPLMELQASTDQDTFQTQLISPAAMVSGQELPLLLSFPRSSVPGLMVDNIASFGRSVILSGKKPKRTITLGHVMHKGETYDNVVELDLDKLNQHCFITGSTGSGKSNTTSQLLSEFYHKGIPFLVIEPAKGEYKIDFGNLPNINIFWTNPNEFQMLHLNPFRFPNEIHVLEHLDRLIEMFSACWPLTAAMPSILKDTMERSYEVCGWDMAKSICLNPEGVKYPTFTTVQNVLEQVINATSYSAESKGDYKGALGTRIRSLTRGIMGQVFCSEEDLRDEILFDENTIIDLSRVGSVETKSLIMGILIMKLNEYRSAKATSKTQNSGLRHVTVLEEAHNLLRRVSPGSGSDVQSKSIEMISNGIAEMRTYGEGFLIIDQSPTAVDISAIKNTNTKIVMRLPEESDFTTIGGAFSLEKDQIREIPRLGIGEAIVSQSGWLQPILTKINNAGDAVACWHYEKKETDHVTVRKTNANLCVMLVNQIETGQCGDMLLDENGVFSKDVLAPYTEILRTSTLTSFKQKEILEHIRRYLTEFQPHLDKDKARIGKMIIEILDCAGLFHTIPLKFRDVNAEVTDEDRQNYARWIKRIARGLGNYAEFAEKIDRDRMLIYMRSYLIKTGGHYTKLKHKGWKNSKA